MNIQPLINAVEQLDIAEYFTPEPKERAEIKALADLAREQLQKRGVFIGKRSSIQFASEE